VKKSEKQASGGETHAQARESASPGQIACSGTTKAGEPCPSAATQRDGRCWWHSTLIDEATRKAARARGAAAFKASRTLSPADLSSAASARRLVEETINLVRRGLIPVTVANAVQRLVSTGLQANEQELGERIAEIERQLSGR
jgi:hypothetical protein